MQHWEGRAPDQGPTHGVTYDAQALEMVEGLQVQGDKTAAAEQIKGLYNTFTKCDCTMVEVTTALLRPVSCAVCLG